MLMWNRPKNRRKQHERRLRVEAAGPVESAVQAHESRNQGVPRQRYAAIEAHQILGLKSGDLALQIEACEAAHPRVSVKMSAQRSQLNAAEIDIVAGERHRHDLPFHRNGSRL